MALIGTMRLDKKGIPKEIKSLEHGEEQNIMLVSCIDQKKSVKKNVIVLIAMHDNVSVTKNKRSKLDVHVIYNLQRV